MGDDRCLFAGCSWVTMLPPSHYGRRENGRKKFMSGILLKLAINVQQYLKYPEGIEFVLHSGEGSGNRRAGCTRMAAISNVNF